MMLAIINLVGKYWYVAAVIAWTAIVFGYGYKMASDKCERDMQIAVNAFQAQANEVATQYEKDRSNVDNNRKKVYYAKKSNDGDCFVTTNKLQVFNAAFTNDTSKLD